MNLFIPPKPFFSQFFFMGGDVQKILDNHIILHFRVGASIQLFPHRLRFKLYQRQASLSNH